MSLWSSILKKNFLGRLWTQDHQIFRAGSPRQGLSKNADIPPVGPPVFGEFRGKVEILNPNISSPKGVPSPFCRHTMPLHGESLSSKNGKGGPLLGFSGSIFLNFRIFFKSKRQTAVTPSNRGVGSSVFARRFLVQMTLI